MQRRRRWHSPTSFVREAWREWSSWIAVLGFGLCAWLFDPPALTAIGDRLDAVAALAGKLGVAAAAVLLLARRSRDDADDAAKRC